MSESLILGSSQACLDSDESDPLAPARARFHLPDGITYLDGHSLGCLPAGVAPRVADVVAREWGQGGVTSWHDAGDGAGWLDLSLQVGRKIERLVGASEGQIIATDTVSINLFKAVVSALRLRPDRKLVVAERDGFPGDLYIIKSAAKLVGAAVRLVEASAVMGTVGPEVAAVVLSHVNYRSAAVWDMAEVSRVVHEHDALVVFDLAHSAGVLDCRLDEAGVDFAVGCGYKYLNGGPGAPGFLYAARRHLSAAEQPLQGWFAHLAPFAFTPLFQPAPGIARFMCGTPPILSMAALDAALDVFDGVSMTDIEAKSRGLTGLFIDLFASQLVDRGYALRSETRPAYRGSHVAVSHDDGARVFSLLTKAGFLGDFRRPDILRFGFSPLYTRYADVHNLVGALATIADGLALPAPPQQRLDSTLSEQA